MADLDLARVKRNVAKMASQNAPEADIDGYIASEGTTVEAVRAFRPGAVPRPDTFGGVGMNTTAGVNDVIYGTLGAPVDLMRGGMNLAVRGFNAATGAEVPTIPENSFGGSRFIGETMGAIRPELDPQNTVADEADERIARGVGQGVSGTVLPAGLVGAAGRAGVVGPQAAEIGAQVFGRSNSVRSVGAEALTGAAAGAGAATAAEFTPEQYRSIGTFAGGLAGGGVGAALTGIPGLVREGASLAGRYLEPFTQGGREQMAGRILRDAATDPQAAREAAAAGPAELVPGSRPTTFQQTGDMGLGGLERASQTRFPAEFNQRRADQNQARVAALEGIQPGGAPEKVALSIRSYLDAIDGDASTALAAAQESARTGASGIGAGLRPDETGAAMRASLETARARAKEQERALWSAVDPDGTMAVSAANARGQAADILRTMPASAKPPAGEEAAVLDVLGRYGDVVPFGEVTALSSRLKAAMREERLANGESPAYRRMSQLNGAIQRDLDGVVASKVQRDAEAVASGQMRAEDTLEAAMLRQREEWVAGRQAGAGTQARAAGADSPTGFGATGAVRPSAIPSASGGPREAGGRLPNSPSDPRLSIDGPATFDRAAQERLTAANAATRERVQTFDNAMLGPIRRRPATNAPYDMPNASVPRRVFSANPQSFEAIQTYRHAVGDAEANATLEPYVVGQARQAAMNEDGTFDAGRLARWRQQHQDALRALPDLDARLADVGRISQTVGDVAVSRRQQVEAVQKGALGRFIGTENPEEVTRTIGGLLSRQDGARQLAQIRQAVGDDPEAMEGLRKAAADFITGRLIGNTEVGTSGQAGIRSDQYQTFIRQNAPALRTIFSEAEVQSMEAVAADLQRAARSQNAVRIPGQSNTAQDTLAVQGGDSPVSILTKIIGASATTGGGVGAVGGPIAGTIAGVGTLFGAALRENGIRRVDELVCDALLNPDRAAALMSGVRASKPERETAIAKRYRASVAASGGMALDEEDVPRNPVMDLMRSAPVGDPDVEGGSDLRGFILGPRAEAPAPRHPKQSIIDILMQGQPQQNGTVDPKLLMQAAMLKSRDNYNHLPPRQGNERLNEMQRKFIAQRLLSA